jgi:hypothetical protein
MNVTFIGTEPEVQLSPAGDHSINVQRGVPIEIPDDWRDQVLSNPNFILTPVDAQKNGTDVEIVGLDKSEKKKNK